MSKINTLNLVRQQILRQNRVNQAQLLLAKAYRGVPYTDAQHDDKPDAELTYRGVQHHTH